ncbi:uncharacterized protein LOC126555882 [Aphis gossypii]|uniref:uncharacterized protein LOC126555882 n=1 Tax=Aphis gossypii TaxID=80765 RepID=UPI002159151C|nr:uncharacterized protein LOC126555882 [Aphis gossypii]
MLEAAYKHLLDTIQSSRRTLMTIDQKDGNASWKATMAREYRAHVDVDLNLLCVNAQDVVKVWLASDWSYKKCICAIGPCPSGTRYVMTNKSKSATMVTNENGVCVKCDDVGTCERNDIAELT